ncbi:MAG: APC family permease, partial [Elusimicrobia bacterium]|nr:APC family permease [Elusimicrobiota bacterium]
REAFGERAGFAVGWLSWVTQVFGWAAVADGIAVYLGFFDPALSGPVGVKCVAFVVITAMGALNYRGVKLGAWTADFFTAAKLIPLLVFVAVGLPKVSGANFATFAPHGIKPMGAACFLCYFAFQGFEGVPVPSGEAKDAKRHTPIALLASLSLASVVYMAVQFVAVGVFPGLAESDRPLAEAAMAVLGPAGAVLMVVGAVVSTTGYNATTALVSPRYLVALAEDGHLPASLAETHPRFGTPARSILLTTGLVLALAMFLDFDKLVDFGNVVVCGQYAATCAAVPLLRRQGAAPFTVPGGWLIPGAGVLATLWLGAQGGLDQVWWAIGVLAAGLALRGLLALKN